MKYISMARVRKVDDNRWYADDIDTGGTLTVLASKARVCELMSDMGYIWLYTSKLSGWDVWALPLKENGLPS